MIRQSLTAVLIVVIVVGLHLLASFVGALPPIVTGVALVVFGTWLAIKIYTAVRGY
jgi:hypothetical protein